MPSVVATAWVEGPPAEIQTLLNERNNGEVLDNDESSSLTPNSCDFCYPGYNYFHNELPIIPVTRIPSDNEEGIPNNDHDGPRTIEGVLVEEMPGGGEPQVLRNTRRRVPVSVLLGMGLLVVATIVSATPSLCYAAGQSGTISFCLFGAKDDGIVDSSDESKLTNYLNSITLSGEVNRSLVKAILRRGDLELPWDADRIRQRYALGTLLGADFIEYEDECTVNDDVEVVCDEEGMVEALSLSGASLQGPLPEDLGLLSNKLRVLDLQGNSITGKLPSQALSVLTKLTHLDLSDNQLSGQLPASLGVLKQLSSLKMSNNVLYGPVPSDLCNLALLRELHLARNHLTGTFPDCAWENMEAIYLDGNQFVGPLPPQAGRWSNLKEMNVSSNRFTGSVPDEWVGLTNVEVFAVSNNKLIGQFPEMFQHWPDIQVLDVSYNDIGGSIPPEVCHLRKLQQFLASNTNVTGTLPNCIGSWTKLQTFDIYQTSITGTLPTEVGRWADLKSFSVARTLISGKIPAEISEWESIETAWFDGTNLKGDMPLCHRMRRTGRELFRKLDSLGANCERVYCPCCRSCY